MSFALSTQQLRTLAPILDSIGLIALSDVT